MIILSCSKASMYFVAWKVVCRNVEEPSLNTSGQNLPTQDHEMALCVVLLPMDHFGEDLAGS